MIIEPIEILCLTYILWLAFILWIHSCGSTSLHVSIAVCLDALPHLLSLCWLLLAVLLVTSSSFVVLLIVALACLAHLYVVLPLTQTWWSLSRSRRSAACLWLNDPSTMQFTICVSNVLFDNQTPDVLISAILQQAADVVVIVEWNPEFALLWDRMDPGCKAYPHRVVDAQDSVILNEYSVCVLSRHPLLPTPSRTFGMIFMYCSLCNCSVSPPL